MCGISGFYNINFKDDEDELFNKTIRMISNLKCRGPDDSGVWVDPNVGIALGHRRLSIIDPSPLGHQPMVSSDKKHVITYNGEIYNFKEIRNHLKKEGYRFRTESDTEVILASYKCYGHSCVMRFNGMFAFAIWDIDKKELFLARDRFGVKPLFYYWKDGFFIFGSEIKSILGYGSLNLTLNLHAIYRYFYLSYIVSPHTVYNEINKLDAGYYIILSNNNYKYERWYELAPFYYEKKLKNIKVAEAKLQDTLNKSVQARMIADVPIGAFLSGGVDSSIIVGLMAKNSVHKVRTFNIGYHDSPVYDESRYAREVAAFYGTDHTEIILSIHEGLEVIPEALNYFDQPFGDSSAIPTFLLSRETSRSVKVSLSGDGGDEIFAGYSKYLMEAYAPYFAYVPRPIRMLLRRCVADLPEGRQTRFHEFIRQAKKVVRSADPDQITRHCSLMFPLEEEEISKLLFHDVKEEIRHLVMEYMGQIPGGAVDRALYTDINLCLKDDMLVKVDLMGMANSLEVRNPFLDFRVVELAASMPEEWKLKRNKRKNILLSAFRDFLPPSILSRPKKGFGVPVGEWLRKELKGTFEDTVSRKNVNRIGVLRYDAVDRLFHLHVSGKRDATPLLWSILAFQWWANKTL